VTFLCARGRSGLPQDQWDGYMADLTAAVERFLETQCQAASEVLVPARSHRDDQTTYHCGLSVDHSPEDGHRWPADPERLIVAWCDWPALPSDDPTQGQTAT
jgi:hypothetical protein